MENSFHIGQVVVCIDDKGLPVPYCDRAVTACPQEGCVYTIRGILVIEDRVGLWLEEIRNPPAKWLDGEVRELAFRSWRFRPAKTTSLEVFEAMLAPRETEMV